MRTLIIFALVLLPILSVAQTINNVPLKDIDVEYVQIVGTSRLMSNKLTVEIDFGQENSFWTSKDTELRDGKGKKVVFNSMIDALNFMTRNGYDYVDSYTVSLSNNQNVYYYLLRRRRN